MVAFGFESIQNHFDETMKFSITAFHSSEIHVFEKFVKMILNRFETESKHHQSTQRGGLPRFHRFPIKFWLICQILEEII